jgi:chlorobactene glucosyltransferase
VKKSFVLGVAAGIYLFLRKSWRNYQALPELGEYPEAANEPDVTVIVPARNEAERISRVVSSFAHSAVLVVDDQSTDRTAEIAQGLGAQVIAAPPLKGKARGKPNACLEGARHATTKWICFADADTWFEPRFLANLVAYAEREQCDMVSAFLRSERVTPMEKLLLPYAFALYFVGVSARAVNSSESSEALANGQCILFRRSSYWTIGGHGAVIDSVIEDVALAEAAKKAKLRTRVIRAERQGAVRMYDGLRAIWNGFRKNSFRFLLVNPGTGLQVIAASILLTSSLPALCYAINRRGGGRAFLPAALLIASPMAGLWSWYGSAWALLSPAAIYLFQLIALDGMLSTLTPRGAVWKGRRV